MSTIVLERWFLYTPQKTCSGNFHISLGILSCVNCHYGYTCGVHEHHLSTLDKLCFKVVGEDLVRAWGPDVLSQIQPKGVQ